MKEKCFISKNNVLSALCGKTCFKNEFKSSFKNIISATFAVLACTAVVLSVIAGGIKLAYNVKLNGKVITTVSDKKVYYAAVQMLEKVVESDNVFDVLPDVQIDTVVTVEDTVNDCETVVDAIIDNTDEIISASRLIVNGNILGCGDTSVLADALEIRKHSYESADFTECVSEFCDEVNLEEGYFLQSDVIDTADLLAAVSELDVKTCVTVSYDASVPYKTVTKSDPQKQIGYTEVQQSGENGINRITSENIYINGEETEKTSESVEVISEPSDEIVVVGTAKPKTVASVTKSGFCFPLPKGTWEISCPYGKNGHKGVDLRAPLGTSIMAAAAGRVTLAGRYMDYGNCVIIDHGNGISTLYAHSSRLCVNVGDYVSAGEVIALVGSTGNSTGNHLHFEVYIGKDRVNPQPYIGL